MLLYNKEVNTINIKLHTDGGCTSDGRAAISFIVTEDKNVVFTTSQYVSRCQTNNEAEYEALYQGLSYIAKAYNKADIGTVEHISDSKLLVSHFNDTYDVKKEELIQKMKAIKSLCSLTLEGKVTSTHVRRDHNTNADWLCNLILDTF